MGGQRHASAALPPVKTRYPSHRKLVGTQGRSGQVRKISPPPRFDPRTVQAVAIHYTNWATPAHNISAYFSLMFDNVIYFYVISDLRRGVHDIFALIGFSQRRMVVHYRRFGTTYRVPSSRFGKKLPFCAEWKLLQKSAELIYFNQTWPLCVIPEEEYICWAETVAVTCIWYKPRSKFE
jgi:hypothetical protein